MPVTRSAKSYPVNTQESSSTAPTCSTGTDTITGTEKTATTSEHTRSTYATRTTGATVETDVTIRQIDAAPTATSPVSQLVERPEAGATTSEAPRRICSPKSVRSFRSGSSNSRRKKLAEAQQELLKLKIDLLSAKIAAMEEESDEDDPEEATIREERTSEWIRTSTIGLRREEQEDYTAATRTKEDILKGRPAESQAPPPTRDVIRQEKISTYAAPATAGTRCPPTNYAGGAPPSTYVTHTSERQQPQYYRNNDGHLEHKPPSDICYEKLATAITTAARAIQPTTARLQELPIFNGSSSDWLPFKTAYEESAGLLTEQENLARLRRSLKGTAREAAQCLFVGATSSNEVMSLLTSRFGRSDALALAELSKLRTLPRLGEHPRDICNFASKIINVTATLKALNRPHYLHNAEIVRAVVEKLPSALRYRYYDFAAEQPEYQPDLVTLTEFMQRTAARCGSYAPVENTPVEDRREPAGRRPMKSCHTQIAKPAAHEQVTTCPICDKTGHHAAQCDEMKTADVTTRWDVARKHRLCFRCLRTRKFRHTCKNKRCGIDGCEYMHHSLLHGTPPSSKEKKEAPASFVVASAKDRSNTTALLKVLPVQVRGPKGTCNALALLDDGSTCSLIEAALARRIGAAGTPAPFYIEGVAGTRINVGESQQVRISLRGRDTNEHTITARTMNNLKLSPQAVPRNVIRACPHLHDLEEHLIYEEGSPTILLGQDNWHLLLTHAVRQGDRHQPIATLTDLGWVLHGTKRSSERVNTHKVLHAVAPDDEESMEQMMREHFSLESLAVTPRRSHNDDERRALQQLEDKTRRLPAGGFETGLLWRNEHVHPPDSYDVALRRLELVEKKLDRDEVLKKRYEKQLQTLFDNDYAEIAPPHKNPKTWYLPHFAVINPQKPEKLRLVHDAAAKAKGVSLNDMLLPGPDLIQSLPGVLMKFRQRPVAVAADIRDMFLRVTIREEDRDMQRFLWRGDDRDRQPTEYRMKSVIFGATSSPCTAIYVKDKNAEHFRAQYPEATAAIIDNHYVDDYLASFDDEGAAVRISTQVAYIHSRANYFLQRWASNSRRVLSTLSPGSKGDILQLDSTKVLGMVWQPEEDTLSFNINTHKTPAEVYNGARTPTKREALRTTMSIFDPLGIATPVTIQAKRIIQDTWRSGIDWDTPLEAPEADAWSRWLEDVRRLAKIKVPRCYMKLSHARGIQLHTVSNNGHQPCLMETTRGCDCISPGYTNRRTTEASASPPARYDSTTGSYDYATLCEAN
ncbi:uncharacterized protein LOC113232330 [Hyposmocoma kahamanoa]|uniref:uncharacterized protein LOC113232330 n=1 Tax=Hyposmocoma kahamanoa TaxID=1477025 RepID=UPI000E6D8CB1|nr:uncharacterized protein LOC113232330 [Hyposmocoma kahamanoa]